MHAVAYGEVIADSCFPLLHCEHPEMGRLQESIQVLQEVNLIFVSLLCICIQKRDVMLSKRHESKGRSALRL